MSGGVGTPLAVAGSCELIWVDGPDAASFLQGILTNDVARLDAGESCPALILDNKGHIRGAMRVVRTGAQAFTLVTGPGEGEPLVGLLDEYHFSEDVDVIGAEAFAAVTLHGPAPASIAGADLVIAGDIPGTIDAIGVEAEAIVAALGATPGSPVDLEILRVEAGVPRFGVDFTAANLVQEAGLETTAVSFDKGCYLGQETVARVAYRGRVNRRLRGLVLPVPTAAGRAVRHDGRDVGLVTSSVVSPRRGPIALAMIRSDVDADASVEVEGLDGPVLVVELPFTKPLHREQ